MIIVEFCLIINTLLTGGFLQKLTPVGLICLLSTVH